ncbi:MAG: galactose mutarotase [Bacteroidales bacterium]|jgi:aldose 1-epimerase|nr:galactose mutarotase [Bacteroidales bacterium]
MKTLFYLVLLPLLVFSCTVKEQGVELLPESSFSKVIEQDTIALYTLTNSKGAVVQVTNYGARVVALWVADKEGNMQDVVWGYNSIDTYLTTSSIYSGPIVGRFGNRIAKGKFTLDGQDYQLSINDGENHLHGGTKGFESCIWEAEEIVKEEQPALKMTYLSKDGEEGYPGNLTLSVIYSFNDNNELLICYEASTDAPTIINPTSHVYFNLSGTTKNTILNHVLQINADSITPTDDGLIPTGEILAVAGTPMDFNMPTPIGERIDQDYEALKFGMGYDHNFVLNKNGEAMSTAAVVYSPESGIRMSVLTDQPAIQFYSGNFMDGSTVGRHGDIDTYRSGFALEAQNYPDAPNHDNFPSSVLRPGETYTQNTLYRFDIVN